MLIFFEACYDSYLIYYKMFLYKKSDPQRIWENFTYLIYKYNPQI